MSRQHPLEWNGFTKFLHWTIAILIIIIAVIGLTHDAFDQDTKRTIMGIHKALGATVLVLMSVRLIWNILTPSPGRNALTPVWQHMVAKLVHWGIYIAVFMQAISGWRMSNAGGRPVSYFGWFDLPTITAKSKEVAEQMHEVHETVFWVLAALLVLHIAAAAYHQYFLRDNLIARMLPGKGRPAA